MSAVAGAAFAVAAATPDPELPVVTIGELGILRDVHVEAGKVVAVVTPTYSGCPAMREIGADVRRRLTAAGHAEVEVRTRLAPPWTTDWITPEGRAKLAAAGIAPPAPARHTAGPVPLTLRPPTPPACPRCGASDTRRTSAFGATACKALFRCEVCSEPFEGLKAL